MRRLLLIGGAAALIALPSVALAGEPEQIDEPDPTAEADRPPMASISGVISRTSGINRALGSRLGSAV